MLHGAAAARMERVAFRNVTLDTHLFDLSWGGALQLQDVALSRVEVADFILVGTAADDGCGSRHEVQCLLGLFYLFPEILTWGIRDLVSMILLVNN